MKKRFINQIRNNLVILIILIPIIVHPQTRIVVDGKFNDWETLSPAHQDPLGDLNNGTIDFGKIWITNDDKYLFIRVELGDEINLQDLNDVHLYLDTDNNKSSGLQFNSIGAELVWHFGGRTGQFYVDANSFGIQHANIGIVTAPTVSSEEFEIAIDRTATPFQDVELFPQESFKIQFANGGEHTDFLPDLGQTISYEFTSESLPALPLVSFEKQNSNHLRILSYNVELDALFAFPKRVPYSRILGAIEPDIIGFQEIYSNSAAQTAQLIGTILPLTSGQIWHAEKIDPDIVVVSQFPIISSYAIEGNGAFLIDLRPKFDTELLFIVAHPPCCANDQGRQFEIDAMMAFVKDAKNPGGILDINSNTPIIISGDMNLVGFSQQLRTLLSGDIVFTGQFGQPFSPDWDDSDLTSLSPFQLESPFTFTWYNPNSSFSPGILDYIVYTDSVLEPENGFVLFTPGLSSNSLNAYRLEFDDTTVASDHLPVVGDFSLKKTTSVENTNLATIPKNFILEQNYPNPVLSSTAIQFTLYQKAIIDLSIYNLKGQLVRRLFSGELEDGKYTVNWDGKDLSSNLVNSGRYFYYLTANEKVIQKQITLMR